MTLQSVISNKANNLQSSAYEKRLLQLHNHLPLSTMEASVSAEWVKKAIAIPQIFYHKVHKHDFIITMKPKSTNPPPQTKTYNSQFLTNLQRAPFERFHQLLKPNFPFFVISNIILPSLFLSSSSFAMNLSLFFLPLLISSFPTSLSALNERYVNCRKASGCNNLTLTYPLYGGSRPDYCGYQGFEVNCDAIPQITISNHTYNLLSTNDQVITVSRTDKWESHCPDSITNTSIDFSIFNFSTSDQNITFFYDCGDTTGISDLPATCDGVPSGLPSYYLTQEMLKEYNNQLRVPGICKSSIFIPILQSEAEKINNQRNDLATVINAFKVGFELEMVGDCEVCKKSGGECGYDWDQGKFVCYCRHADYDVKCPEKGTLCPISSASHKHFLSYI